jgi:hypothetical protein
MIRKSGNRFSDKIMLKRPASAGRSCFSLHDGVLPWELHFLERRAEQAEEILGLSRKDRSSLLL